MFRLPQRTGELPKWYRKKANSIFLAAFIAAIPPSLALAQEHQAHSPSAAAVSQLSPDASARDVKWTTYPALVPGGRGERGAAVLAPINSRATVLSVIFPDTSRGRADFPLAGKSWSIRQPDAEVGGYHLLQAREASDTEIRTASTLWMFQSKPQSPDRMLADARSGLEVLPLKLPQFGGFREGQTAEFAIRLDGLPVAGGALTMDTENGSHETVLADANGIARMTFPRDFDPVAIEKEGGAARARRSFVLGAEMERNGIRYTTGLSLPYLPDLMRERSLMAGAGLFIFGMLLATPLLRRKKEAGNV